jgi:hypothetical protein
MMKGHDTPNADVGSTRTAIEETVIQFSRMRCPLSAFGGAPEDFKIAGGRCPTTLLASGVKFSAPDFGAS